MPEPKMSAAPSDELDCGDCGGGQSGPGERSGPAFASFPRLLRGIVVRCSSPSTLQTALDQPTCYHRGTRADQQPGRPSRFQGFRFYTHFHASYWNFREAKAVPNNHHVKRSPPLSLPEIGDVRHMVPAVPRVQREQLREGHNAIVL